MEQRRMFAGVCVLLMAMASFLAVPAGAKGASKESAPPAAGTQIADDGVTMPKPVQTVPPVYPEQERKAGIVGTVLLSVEIKSDGTVGTIKTEEDVAGHPAFTSSAMAAVGKWRFEPAQREGHAVACTVKIPIRFALDEKKPGK
jgi:periplasmic protein TonB